MHQDQPPLWPCLGSLLIIQSHYCGCSRPVVQHHCGPQPLSSISVHPVMSAGVVTQDNHTNVLFVVSSVVLHVQINRCCASCHLGALNRDIYTSAHLLLPQHPPVSTIVVHVATNYLKMLQSEKLFCLPHGQCLNYA